MSRLDSVREDTPRYRSLERADWRRRAADVNFEFQGALSVLTKHGCERRVLLALLQRLEGVGAEWPNISRAELRRIVARCEKTQKDMGRLRFTAVGALLPDRDPLAQLPSIVTLLKSVIGIVDKRASLPVDVLKYALTLYVKRSTHRDRDNEVSTLCATAEMLVDEESQTSGKYKDRIYSAEVHRAWRKRVRERTKHIAATVLASVEADITADEKVIRRARQHREAARLVRAQGGH
jgi:hypothetical protein